MMAEAPALITVPLGKKNKKGKVTNTAMVLHSLTPTLPIVVPEATVHLEDSTKSAPSSPERGRKKGFLKKHLPRIRSPSHLRASHSDPESSPQPRPRTLGFKKKKVKKTADQNGDTPTVQQSVMLGSSSGSSCGPEATPMEDLPGRTPMVNSGVPEIRVISDPNISGGLVSFEEIGDGDGGGLEPVDPYRKNSQSSRCSSGSGLVSVGTSGFGSLLSPSGDESYPGSDLESPLSPYSGASSFTEDAPSDMSDLDPIDRDYPRSTTKSPPSAGSSENVSVTTPTPTGESPPKSPHNALNSSNATLVSPTSPDGPNLGKEHKKKKDKQNRQNVWMKVRNAVKAWSPFAVQFKKKYYPWVQLAGHEGNFLPGEENGTIMKKSSDKERSCLRKLMEDSLRDFVPEFRREVEHKGEMYVEMADLLREFNEPAVMDIKMGTRTYLEEELGKKNVLRKDMYRKMIDVDPNEPTPEEHEQEAITKPRYMQWRESLSSTSTLGFRIEGIKTTTGKALKDFKKTRTPEEVTEALQTYIAENPSVKAPVLKRLQDIRATLARSEFFTKHELIGSSLLFVYDNSGLSSVNMIDFGKTTPLPEGVTITHSTEWIEGNHEDGYLYGLDNLIRLWREL